MIAMFVGDQDGIERLNIFADVGQPAGYFTATQSSVDEQAGSICRDKGRVSGATAGEYADLDDGDPLTPNLIGCTRRMRTKN